MDSNGKTPFGLSSLDAADSALSTQHSALNQHSGLNSGNSFWALDDVSFEVQRGEVVGIIGRNGAGKSTLLKILSRITKPTKGHATINGRVGSLLEVGTGFHPELTGRENIYLNAAILGMRKAEVALKFDEIVAFAEVEKFIDTPVKRYSSGMYVRLAFAVAAHMETEVLLIDEVLAVGDAQFQKKCLGKIGEVANQGRTVLFVSHNMDTVMSLCSAGILLTNGKNVEPAPTQTAIKMYLSSGGETFVTDLSAKPRFQLLNRSPIIKALRIQSEGSNQLIPTGGSALFEVDLGEFADISACDCGIIIADEFGQRIAAFHTYYQSQLTVKGDVAARLMCHVPSLPLVVGRYYVDIVLAAGYQVIEKIERAGTFEIVFADVFGTGRIPGPHQGRLVLECDWSVGR